MRRHRNVIGRRAVRAAAVMAAAGLLASVEVAAGDSTLFWGGSPSGPAYTDERNTSVTDSRIYDDFTVTGAGWRISFLGGVFDPTSITPATGYYEIRSGVSAGNGGTLIASGNVSITNFGISNFGPQPFGPFVSADSMEGMLSSPLTLNPGTYWMTFVPVGSGSGRAYLETTNGQFSTGGTISDGKSFIDSPYTFSNGGPYNFASTSTLTGGSPADFSYYVNGNVVGGGNWTNTSNTNNTWSTGSNWTNTAAPGTSDSVTFNASGNYTVNVDAGATANNLTVTAGSPKLSLAGNSLTLAGSGTVFVVGGSGTVNTTIDGGTVALASGSLTIANGSGAASLNLTGNSSVTANFIEAGYSSVGSINVAAGSSLIQSGNGIRNYIGENTSSGGAIYNAGNLSIAGTTNTDGLYVGQGTSAYGYLQSSGATSIAGRLRLGVSASGASVVDINGGNTTISGTNQSSGLALSMNFSASSNVSQINVTNGGTLIVANGAVANQMTINGGTSQYAAVNITGSGSRLSLTPFAGASVLLLNSSGDATDVATVTLGSGVGSGGELDTTDVDDTSGNSTNILTFNGGTLKAVGNASAGLIVGHVRTYVQAGGGVIDNGGFNAAIPTALQAPTGNGVTSVTLSGSKTGYIGAPVVKFSGGNGTGAAGYAVFDPTTGNITSIVVTSPGSGYTSPPTVTLVGGSATPGVGAGVGTATATATTGTVTSGGMTFQGNGNTTLTGNNTYTGGTTLLAGKLFANNAVSSLGSGTVAVNGGTLAGNGVVANGSQSLSVNVGGTISAGPNGNTTGRLTSGNQTWNGGGQFVVKMNGAGSPNISGTPAAGGNSTTWDELAMSGLSVLAGPLTGGRFNISLQSYGGATGSPNTAVSGFNGASTYVWPIATLGSTAPLALSNGVLAQTDTSGTFIGNSSAVFSLDTTNFVADNPGAGMGNYFLDLTNFGGVETLDIRYQGTPEPGTALLCALGAGPLLLRRRRRGNEIQK